MTGGLMATRSPASRMAHGKPLSLSRRAATNISSLSTGNGVANPASRDRMRSEAGASVTNSVPRIQEEDETEEEQLASHPLRVEAGTEVVLTFRWADKWEGKDFRVAIAA